MSAERLPSTGATAFRARLVPHRSLSPVGFIAVMLIVGVASFVAGIVFLLLGAWPVIGFFCLDVLLIYVAFKLNYRAARQYELIELTDASLKVTRVHRSGHTQSFEFNPYWVRLDVREYPDGRADLRLGSHGREISFGRFLSEAEKRDLAKLLQSALAAARTSGGALSRG